MSALGVECACVRLGSDRVRLCAWGQTEFHACALGVIVRLCAWGQTEFQVNLSRVGKGRPAGSIELRAGLLVSVLFSPERESTPIILGGTKQLVKGAFSSPQGAVSAEPAGT